MDFYHPPTNQGTIDALGSVYRALRTWKFYPKGHPTRSNAIKHAHSSMLKLLDGNNLSLSCSRNCFSFPDGERLADASRLTASLSHELFIRRIQKITFLEDLFQDDLLDFLRIIILSPDTIQKMGGVAKIMSEHGIRSIWTNEFDLSAIREQRSQVEARGITPLTLDEVENIEDTNVPTEQEKVQEDYASLEQQLQALLGRLSATSDEDIYARLLRQAISCADALISRLEIAATFPLVELLASHAGEETHSTAIRDFDKFALEQLSISEEFLRYAFEQMDQSGSLTKKALQAVLGAGGPPAITMAAELMGNTGNIAIRKTIASLLASLGEEALPVLLNMIDDHRWYLIRNICVIFGAIASNNALPGLSKCLHHPELRVSKEAIRSLTKIGGREAESALIGILRSDATELYPQAMLSLGSLKCRRSLTELLRLLSAKDPFLKLLPLKIDALKAIAMIGDKQVTPRLADLLTERHLLASSRWKHLKVAIAQCLGKLGDSRALPSLVKHASNRDELGAACCEAIELIEHSGGKPDGSN